MSDAIFSVVGQRPIRHDGVDKVTGRANYGADFSRPGMLFGAVLRSPYAHARIVSIDTAEAEAVPGVMAVVTGVDIPETLYPSSAAEAAGMPLPVLVKPQHPDGFKRRFGKQAFRCETRAELERAYAQAEPFGPMVQELIPGGDEELYSLGSYLRHDGEPLGLFSGRKLKQVPPEVGTCRVGEAVWVQEVVDAGLRFLRGLGFHGISQVEFTRDPRDGRNTLMEINPRLWQGHGLAAACGVDLPVIAYRDLTGEQVSPASMNGSGKRWAISVMPCERPAVPRPPYVDAVFAKDDLRPGLVHMARVARSVLP